MITHSRPARAPLFGLATLLTAGCYGSVHEPPQRPTIPTLAPDARAELGGVEHAAHLDSTGRYWDRSTSLRFSYGGVPVSYSQYRAIVDPKWKATLDTYDDLAARCQRANIPKYLGYTAIVGGFAFGIWGNSIVGDNEQLQGTVFYSMLGAGVASYLVGYLFLGGRACNEAGRMWDGEDPWLEYADETSVPSFRTTSAELQQLTDTFNARVMKAGAPQAARADD